MASFGDYRQIEERSKKHDMIIPPQVGYSDNSLRAGSLSDFSRVREQRNIPGFIQIGDVEFIVPPQSISVQVESKNESINTIRSKGSIKTKTGFSDTTIIMELYFHNIDSINGYRIDGMDGSYWYINGLRPLIAQFKKTPFVPVINYDLNVIHSIHSVTLKDITAQTVPGFPDSIMVKLTMLKFNHLSHLSYTPDFYDAINWQLFRWFYQQCMNPIYEDNENRTYLSPYVKCDNSLVFSLANENDLIKISQQMMDFNKMVTPSEYAAKNKNVDSTNGKMAADGKLLELGKKQQAKARAKADELQQLKSYSLPEGIYEDVYDTYYIEYGDKKYYDPITNTYIFALKCEDNINMAKKEGLEQRNGKWVIPAGSKTANNIATLYNNWKKSMAEYNEQYQKAYNAVVEPEQQLGYDTVSIPDMHIESMIISIDNVVSSYQIQDLDCPTHQFLAQGDTFIEMRIRCKNEEAISTLVNTVKTAEQYVRQYRIGINAGYLGIDNDLVRLFGVKHIIVNTMNIDTVVNQPGLYDITLVMIGFNKNQRDSEQLKVINDTSNYNSMADVARAANDPQIEQKMKELELYPDLELPTHEELLNFCNNTGIIYPYYDNLTCPYTGVVIEKGKYVDPDFYVYTPNTTRNILKDQIDKAKSKADNEEEALKFMSPQDGGSIIFPKETDTLSTYFPYFVDQNEWKETKQIEDDVLAKRKEVKDEYGSTKTSSGSNTTTSEDTTSTTTTSESSGFGATVENYLNQVINNMATFSGDGTVVTQVQDIDPRLAKVIQMHKTGKNKQYADFIISVGRYALNLKKALPKKQKNALWPSVMLAQAVEESGWGQAKDMVAINNYFGMTALPGQKSAQLPGNWRKFAVFNSFGDGMAGYVKFILSGCGDKGTYKPILKATTRDQAIDALISGGWCSGSNYATNLRNHISYNHFDEWDKLAAAGVSGGDVSYTNNIATVYGPGTEGMNESEYISIPDNDAKLDIGKLWKDSYNDMLETDQRGRLLRAFPTFQMLLIDEGKWVSWVKMWDNFYGFNALQSIDIVKSRKMAADTCLITMTNVYQNLTDININADKEHIYSEEYQWHDLFFNNFDSKTLVEARKEKNSRLMLQTGARIHLRMGYGSDASTLPIVFNGTVTEVEFDDGVINMVSQGDGIELCNAISAKKNAVNDWKKNEEPRKTLCYLLCKHKNIIEQMIEIGMSDPDRKEGILDYIWTKSENPLGIAHFGNPVNFPKGVHVDYFWQDAEKPEDKLGDAGINIYTSAGTGSKSEWVYQSTDFDAQYGDVSKYEEGKLRGWTAHKLWGVFPWPEGDERDITMSLYNKSTWDIAKTCSLIAPDYITTVLPFETRSTLFYGKPYWPYYYRYIYSYRWDEQTGLFEKTSACNVPLSKPMSQCHIYTSQSDIILNKIKASEEGVVTNVIATFEDGVASNVMCADTDIYPEKQKTAIINVDIADPGKNIRDIVAAQSLRDFIKDMYKGNLIVAGDPAVKPYDTMYINDSDNQMFGLAGVKQVVHHMNINSGFTTDIVPDALVVVDDSIYNTYLGLLSSVASATSTVLVAGAIELYLWRKIKHSEMLAKVFEKGAGAKNFTLDKILQYAYKDNKFAGVAPEADAITDLKKLTTALKYGDNTEEVAAMLEKAIADYNEVKNLGKAAEVGTWTYRGYRGLSSVFTLVRVVSKPFVVLAVADIALTIMASNLFDAYSRSKRARQAVMIFPLTYKGVPLTAGLNGHMGCVVGDSASRIDKFWEGESGLATDKVISVLNSLSGNNMTYGE